MSEKIIDLKWKFVKSYSYPHFDKWSPDKTVLMKKYEKETGKRSIYKIIRIPMGHRVLKGKVQLTAGFLKWKNKKKKNK